MSFPVIIIIIIILVIDITDVYECSAGPLGKVMLCNFEYDASHESARDSSLFLSFIYFLFDF